MTVTTEVPVTPDLLNLTAAARVLIDAQSDLDYWTGVAARTPAAAPAMATVLAVAQARLDGALAMWQALTGLHVSEAYAYADTCLTSTTRAATIPF